MAPGRHEAQEAERLRRLHRRGRMAHRQQVHPARQAGHQRRQQRRAAGGRGDDPASRPVRGLPAGGGRDGHAAVPAVHRGPRMGRRLRLVGQPRRVQGPAGLLALSQHQARRVLSADLDQHGRHRRPRGARPQLQVRRADAARAGLQQPHPDPHFQPVGPRHGQAALEADRRDRRQLGVPGEKPGDEAALERIQGCGEGSPHFTRLRTNHGRTAHADDAHRGVRERQSGRRRPALRRRGVQRQSRPGRLGVRAAARQDRQGEGGLRRRARDDQQPDGALGRHPRAGGPEAAGGRRAGDRQRLRRQGVDRMDAEVEGPRLAPQGARQAARHQERRPVAAARRAGEPAPPPLHPRSRPRRPRRERVAATHWRWPPTRNTCGGDISPLPSGRGAGGEGIMCHLPHGAAAMSEGRCRDRPKLPGRAGPTCRGHGRCLPPLPPRTSKHAQQTAGQEYQRRRLGHGGQSGGRCGGGLLVVRQHDRQVVDVHRAGGVAVHGARWYDVMPVWP